jgi:hypothetical protein
VMLVQIVYGAGDTVGWLNVDMIDFIREMESGCLRVHQKDDIFLLERAKNSRFCKWLKQQNDLTESENV